MRNIKCEITSLFFTLYFGSRWEHTNRVVTWFRGKILYVRVSIFYKKGAFCRIIDFPRIPKIQDNLSTKSQEHNRGSMFWTCWFLMKMSGIIVFITFITSISYHRNHGWTWFIGFVVGIGGMYFLCWVQEETQKHRISSITLYSQPHQCKS